VATEAYQNRHIEVGEETRPVVPALQMEGLPNYRGGREVRPLSARSGNSFSSMRSLSTEPRPPSMTSRTRPSTARTSMTQASSRFSKDRGSVKSLCGGKTKVIDESVYDPHDWGRIWPNTGQTYMDRWNRNRYVPDHKKHDPVARHVYFNKCWGNDRYLSRIADPMAHVVPPGGIINQLGQDGHVYHRPVDPEAAKNVFKYSAKAIEHRYTAMTMGRVMGW